MSSLAIVFFLLLLVAVAAVFYFMRLWRRAEQALQKVNVEEARWQTRSQEDSGQRQQLQQELSDARGRLETQGGRIAELETALQNEKSNAAEKLKLLQEARDEMQAQFKNLAQGILDEKSKKFGDDSKQQLTPLLQPLKENMDSFRKRMEDLHGENTKERAALKFHIEQLQANASQISADADNLAKALTGGRGSGKIQGDWGENTLLVLLENSGLQKEEDYNVQQSHKSDDGKRQIPDVVINLPDDKHLIIDAKVSLSAYVDYTTAEDEGARREALQRHLLSVKNHVGQLHEKNYSGLLPNSPDFVLMFMAVEPAYILMLQEDRNLFTDAYRKNVVLVSPTTLMPVLRMVANIWRLEKQQRHAQKIAEQGGRLYDKFCNFYGDMQALGKALEKAKSTYDDANKKLHEGRGNLTLQAQKLHELGVDAKKKLPPEALTSAEEE